MRSTETDEQDHPRVRTPGSEERPSMEHSDPATRVENDLGTELILYFGRLADVPRTGGLYE